MAVDFVLHGALRESSALHDGVGYGVASRLAVGLVEVGLVGLAHGRVVGRTDGVEVARRHAVLGHTQEEELAVLLAVETLHDGGVVLEFSRGIGFEAAQRFLRRNLQGGQAQAGEKDGLFHGLGILPG